MRVSRENIEKVQEKAKQIAQEYLDVIQEFSNEECTKISNEISHKVCQFIQDQNPRDKYVVNTTLFEKGNLGITMSGTCIWDTKVDKFANINYESDKLIVVISIWGLSME